MNEVIQTVRSSTFMVSAKAAQVVGTVVAGIIIARLLLPSEVGIAQLAFLIITLVEPVVNFGLNTAVVQADRTKMDSHVISTAFWLRILLTLGVTAIVLLSVPFLIPIIMSNGTIADEELLSSLVKVSLIVLLIDLVAFYPGMLLRRRLSFGGVALANAVDALVYPILVFMIASRGHGPISIIYARAGSKLSATVVLWLSTGIKPINLSSFNRELARKMFPVAKQTFFVSALTLFATNFDNLIVGTLLGSAALAFYSISWSWARAGELFISQAISPVLLSYFSTIQKDELSLHDNLCSSLRNVYLLAPLLAFGIASVAPTFIPTILGEQWIPAVRLLQIMALTGCLSPLINVIGTALIAVGKAKLVTSYSLFYVVCLFLILLPSTALGGLVAAAIAEVVINVLTALLILYFARREFNISPLKIIFLTGQPIIAAVIAASMTLWLQSRMSLTVVALILLILIFSLVYFLSLLLITKGSLLHVVQNLFRTLVGAESGKEKRIPA